jgi:hypothetical protein
MESVSRPVVSSTKVDPKLLLSEKGMYLGLYEIKIGAAAREEERLLLRDNLMVRVTFVVILKMVGVDLECVGLWGSGGETVPGTAISVRLNE